jgi:hypothetical protein
VLFERRHLRYSYTNITILHGALYDTNYHVRDEKLREGTRFWLDDGVPWPVFTQLCNEFEKCYQVQQCLRRLKAVPFKLRALACLLQLCLSGPMSHHLVTYSMDYNMFCSFYEEFLNWMWLMNDDFIHLPTMDEEINHVERMHHRIGFPGAIGSVCYVHLPWNSSRHTLRMQCINAGTGDSKGKPYVVFQCVVSHTTKCLSISDMFWGATSDATIVKFDKAIKEVMTGVYSTRQFTMYAEDGKKVNEIGLHYIFDGGYPKFKHLIPPCKWTQVGTKNNLWYSAV